VQIGKPLKLTNRFSELIESLKATDIVLGSIEPALRYPSHLGHLTHDFTGATRKNRESSKTIIGDQQVDNHNLAMNKHFKLRIKIIGEGGIGKSALALKAIHECQVQEESCQGVCSNSATAICYTDQKKKER
jgi:hypothetical protein